ncbi:hypothetical protein KHA80_08780 [Anaerobacillus sp. HL2]|nr:hypothetical protein KHA80_08780 [Anaerobacillus sp. HL2]
MYVKGYMSSEEPLCLFRSSFATSKRSDAGAGFEKRSQRRDAKLIMENLG